MANIKTSSPKKALPAYGKNEAFNALTFNDDMKTNTTTNKQYDFSGPSDNETSNRNCKFPLTVGSTVTYGATINDTVGMHKRSIRSVALTGDATINIAAASGETIEIGDEVMYKLANDGTQRTVTFGTGFKASGTVAGTINKTINITFVYDGSNFVEQCRSAAYTA